MSARIRKRMSISLAFLALLIACVAFLTLHPNLLGTSESPYGGNGLSLNEGWTTEDGTPVNFNDLGTLPDFQSGGATVQLRLPSPLPPQAELNFMSSNLRLHLYYDSEEVYAFGSADDAVGMPYATHFNFAPLDPSDEGKVARLELRPVYSNMAARLVDVRITETSAYIQDYVRSHGLALVESLVTVVIGFSVIAFDIVLRKIKHGQLDLLALGSAIILMGIWSATVTKVLQLITGQDALIGALEYMSLLFVPYPIVCFASSLLKPHNRKRYNLIALIIAVATIAITMFLAVALGADMHQLLPIMHVQLLSCAALIGMEVVTAIRENGRSTIRETLSSHNVMMFAFLFFVGCSAADFVVFTTAKSGVSDTAFFVRLGLFVVSAVLAAETARASLMYINRAAYADKVELIAYTDALTNIGNSTAWKVMRDEVESALVQGTLSDAVVCQFDVNFLKKVNDTYGHAAGDRYIKHAANTIQRSFGKEGTCYRTGGDEFTAIIAGEELNERMEQCKRLFEVSMDEQNVAREGDVALSMALGFAYVSEVKSHTLREAQKLADERMYANKRAMKAERVD